MVVILCVNPSLLQKTTQFPKKYCLAHKGDYPVYSGKTEDDGIIGMIDRVDYDVKECLTWTADGVYAGMMFLRSGKFNLTYHSGILQLKEKFESLDDSYDPKDLYLPYVYHILNKKLSKSALGREKQNKRVTVQVVRDTEIEIPILGDGTWDRKKQEDLTIQFNESEFALDEAVKIKNELITVLKKALGR